MSVKHTERGACCGLSAGRLFAASHTAGKSKDKACNTSMSIESGFQFMSECFANEKTIFHYIVNNFTNHAALAVNNSTIM